MGKVDQGQVLKGRQLLRKSSRVNKIQVLLNNDNIRLDDVLLLLGKNSVVFHVEKSKMRGSVYVFGASEVVWLLDNPLYLQSGEFIDILFDKLTHAGAFAKIDDSRRFFSNKSKLLNGLVGGVVS